MCYRKHRSIRNYWYFVWKIVRKREGLGGSSLPSFWQISLPYLNQGRGAHSPHPVLWAPPPDFQTLRRPCSYHFHAISCWIGCKNCWFSHWNIHTTNDIWQKKCINVVCVLKFKFSEKATKFEKISFLGLTVIINSKLRGRFFQICVAFSEYIILIQGLNFRSRQIFEIFRGVLIAPLL